MKDTLVNNATETAERVQQNVRNLPLASLMLAGLVGASAMALVTVCCKLLHPILHPTK